MMKRAQSCALIQYCTLKETEEGIETMCKEMEALCNEAKLEERMEVNGKTALNLNKMGMSPEQIAEALEVSVSTVEKRLSQSVTPVC